ncbi:MAG TPA: PLP-dependent aspartate aminotransferase family protein [Caulifigura sp.]|nr:PLP-dependent aspartate aminotransferase family protein [Caulifigura sp.]
MSDSSESLHFETRCVHTGVRKDNAYDSAITPIYPSSTFGWSDLKTNKGYEYTRSGNPTRRALEENLAALEGGIDCRATSTGMAAIATVMHMFKAGDHIIAGHDIYGGTYRLFEAVYSQFGIQVEFVNQQNLDSVRKAVKPNTKAIWIETPSNPLLNLVDIAGLVELAKKANAITVADNTFLSPYLQRPFEFGVDIVIHSTTKYLNGHSDVVGGAVITRHKEHAEKIGYLVNSLGTPCSPFDAWLVLRGLKTLAPRMEVHQKNAMALARFLEKHPKIERVYYPGLESHPQHALAKKQQKGFGAMVTADIKGNRATAEKAMTSLKVFSLAESLGGVESLVAYPDTMSHASMTEESRRAAGISERTMRLSVGIEHVDDLIADWKQALEA